jgi:hypothetical protein
MKRAENNAGAVRSLEEVEPEPDSIRETGGSGVFKAPVLAYASPELTSRQRRWDRARPALRPFALPQNRRGLHRSRSRSGWRTALP